MGCSEEDELNEGDQGPVLTQWRTLYERCCVSAPHAVPHALSD